MALKKEYKPKKFSKVMGNEFTLKIVKEMIAEKNIPRGLILHWPTGMGKSTLARLIRKSYDKEGQGP